METSPSYIGLPEGLYTVTNKRQTFSLYQIWKDLEGDLFSLWTFIFRHAKHDAYPKNATISKQKTYSRVVAATDDDMVATSTWSKIIWFFVPNVSPCCSWPFPQLRIPVKLRVLMTGTPVHNSLQVWLSKDSITQETEIKFHLNF